MAEHVVDLAGLMQSIAGVLRPGGRLVLSAWHPFMILLGVPTHYEDDNAGVEYVLPSHVHLVSDYLRAFSTAGLRLGEIEELRCDDALIARMPHVHKHRGRPL